VARKVRNVLRRLVQGHGTVGMKRHLWNAEFARGRWDCLDTTPGDCIYPYVEQHANGGSILDLGCGSGSTGNELDATRYRHFVGVDISDVAVEKARRRTEASGRAGKNHYVQSDVLDYVPGRLFDVILFRDSIYYVPLPSIRTMLERYAKYLEERGVFIVRMADGSDAYGKVVDTIEAGFAVVEKYAFDQPKALVIVFRPRPALTR
jgi:SAM-dependent methyltransferase